jgi:hypothetical protein
MHDVTRSNFGLLIAYVLPGFMLLWGVGEVSPGVRAWLGAPVEDAPTIGGFLYATLASVAAGMTVSTIRWLVVDGIHHLTGLRRPRWNFAALRQNVAAFDVMVENHYRYYQFNANMLVALPIAAMLRWSQRFAWPDLLLLAALEAIFFIGSRDTLRKYYAQGSAVLRPAQSGDQLGHADTEGDREALDIEQ